MIEKIYEISCDNCSHTINHIFYKPTIKDLKEDNIICYKGKKVKVILNGKYHNKSNKDNKEVKQINRDNIIYSFDE